ncbi:hypothetical protein Y032_0046g1415 [Ancylostoma ceylanicum]|uniref:Uncharacterized protein n=1 Tax=Ancylostoma ceylanicum TaxID=53326 RepID=A0A016UCV7_9BILA|nr:hypothetical protein Y032_0046g1415 [Ancylostoma ceylanicum]
MSKNRKLVDVFLHKVPNSENLALFLQKYACHLTEEPSFSGAYLQDVNYLAYQGGKQDYNKARDFVLGAVENWGDQLEQMKSKTQFVCTLETSQNYYLICFFE